MYRVLIATQDIRKPGTMNWNFLLNSDGKEFGTEDAAELEEQLEKQLIEHPARNVRAVKDLTVELIITIDTTDEIPEEEVTP